MDGWTDEEEDGRKGKRSGKGRVGQGTRQGEAGTEQMVSIVRSVGWAGVRHRAYAALLCVRVCARAGEWGSPASNRLSRPSGGQPKSVPSPPPLLFCRCAVLFAYPGSPPQYPTRIRFRLFPRARLSRVVGSNAAAAGRRGALLGQ